jgi:hypothetical protein
LYFQLLSFSIQSALAQLSRLPLIDRHGSRLSTGAPWRLISLIDHPYFLKPAKPLDFSFPPKGTAAVRVAFGVYHLHWFPATEETSALVRATVLLETTLHIGCHTGVQTVITGPDDVNIPSHR